MTCNDSKKVLVSRPQRVSTDERGRSVWNDPVETARFELVSTQMLKVMLTSRDASDRVAIAQAADIASDGVLARDTNNGQFEIIEDDELQAILDANHDLPAVTRPADATLEPLRDYADDEQLSLVSTQALRKILNHPAQGTEDSVSGEQVERGFNPYDRH